MPFRDFTLAALKKYVFLEIHCLNLREENLSFDNILFINDSSVIHKIFIFDLTLCSQSGRGRWECLF